MTDKEQKTATSDFQCLCGCLVMILMFGLSCSGLGLVCKLVRWAWQ